MSRPDTLTMPAWMPRRFAARFPRRLYHRARLALPLLRDALALCLWVLPGYAVPLFLVLRALGRLPGPSSAAQLFSGAALLAAIGVWGAVFALPVLERRKQTPHPRLALFLTIHPLVGWLLAPLPDGFGAAVYFAIVIAAACGWAVYQTTRARQLSLTSEITRRQQPGQQSRDMLDSQRYEPRHRMDSVHSLDGPHWLRRRDPSAAAVPETDAPADLPTDVLPLAAADNPANRLLVSTPAVRTHTSSSQAESATPGYLIERQVTPPSAGPLPDSVGQGGGHVSGRVTVVFVAYQKHQVAHIPFWPPFPATPQFDFEVEGDIDLRVQPVVLPWGARLELKRSGDCSRPVTLTIDFHGELAPVSHRVAA